MVIHRYSAFIVVLFFALACVVPLSRATTSPPISSSLGKEGEEGKEGRGRMPVCAPVAMAMPPPPGSWDAAEDMDARDASNGREAVGDGPEGSGSNRLPFPVVAPACFFF